MHHFNKWWFFWLKYETYKVFSCMEYKYTATVRNKSEIPIN